MWLTLGFSGPFLPAPRSLLSHTDSQKAFISEEVECLLLSGAIVRVSSGLLRCVAPLWTAPRKNGKLRLIFDLLISFQNQFLRDAPFCLDDLRADQSRVAKDCFMAKIDLKDAFFQGLVIFGFLNG